MDFFEGGRPKIPLKRRATDTSETWGVKKKHKFKKAPFSAHPTFLDFSAQPTGPTAAWGRRTEAPGATPQERTVRGDPPGH